MSTRVLHEDEYLKVLHNRDYIVVRKDKPYEFHSHFRTLSGAMLLVDLFHKGMLPNKPYFRIAMLRICEEYEFLGLKEQPAKQKYNNCRTRHKRR